MPKAFTLALDRNSARTYDVDGRLRVEASNITRAVVNPYFGKEIPGWEELGLEPARIYNLLRDPVELEKAAPTFTNIPLLIIHKGTTADNHDKSVTVGTVGDAKWQAPYIKASLCVWTEEAIAGIESKQQTELSCGYRYRPDMTPGTYEGQQYDGVMRDIIGNHVALVEVGRAGSDVVVADHNPFKGLSQMKFKTPQAAVVAGALRAYLSPKLAQDAAIGDLGALVANVKARTFAKEHPALAAQVIAKFGSKLAQDAKLDDLQAFLSTLAMDADSDDDMKDEKKAEDGLDDEDDEEEKKRKEAARASDEPGEGNGKSNTEGGPQANTKQAMDAAIAVAVKQAKAEVEALNVARTAVAPLVGHVALDSAEAVYKFALDHAKVDTAGVHPSAYPALLKMHLAAIAAPAPRLGMDSASIQSADKRFEHLGRFGKI